MQLRIRSLFFIYAASCSLFFQAESKPYGTAATKALQSIHEANEAKNEPNEKGKKPTIEGTWGMLASKAAGLKIYQYVTYEKKGDYSYDHGIRLTHLNCIPTKSGQFGLFHTARLIKSPNNQDGEKYKGHKLPGIWMIPSESHSIIYELTSENESDINDFLTFLKDPSKDMAHVTLTKVITKINGLTNERLNVTEPLNPNGTKQPAGYDSFKYKKTTQTTVKTIDGYPLDDGNIEKTLSECLINLKLKQ